MASPGNNNNNTSPFDVNSLFKPSNPNPTITTASYPPPTSGPYPPFPPQQTTPQFHPIYPPYPEFTQPMRSMSYPTPPLTPQTPNPSPSYHYQQQQQNPNPSARLMALLSAPPDISQQSIPVTVNPDSSAVVVNMQQGQGGGGGVMRMPSSKLPKGRRLNGDRLVYDVDVKLPGEVQPQLEVTPITKYGSDPGLVIGRQIAVNKTYICYGLKLGAIRVLNINTASRSLLKGLAQRVTDMDFFAQDVHLLASASTDGRVYVWNITEGSDEEDKPQITGKIVIAIQITGEGESVHPRVCWHCHKQEVLVVGIGKRVLKIDTTKVGRGEKISAEEPLVCSIDKLINGVQLVGSHDGEVTDLSMCQWMTTRLVSASVDGTIKIWEDRKSPPIAVIRPHDGQPVNSVTFLAAPDRPEHIILITGGPFNREMKVWISASEEGWLLPSDVESWNCTQVLELKSSEARPEEAFFNQVVALSQAGLLLLANAKRNAIYAVHLEYGPNPASTRMDYLSEFTVTMPILSFTGTSEVLPHGDQTVQVYCVQTQAIQQYALDLSRCLPPPMENVVFERSESNISSSAAGVDKPTEVSVSSSVPKGPVIDSGLENPPATSAIEFTTSNTESKMAPPLSAAGNSIDIVSSPRASRTQSGFRSTSGRFEPNEQHSTEAKIVEYSVDRQLEAIHGNLSDAASLDDDRSKLPQDDIPMPRSNPIEFKPPTHLVKPSEFLMPNVSSEPKSDADTNIHDVIVSENPRNIVVEVNVVGETGKSQANDIRTQEDISVSGNKEKFFYSQASDLGMEMTRELRTTTAETFVVEEAGQFNENGAVEKQVDDSSKDSSSKAVDSSTRTVAQQSSAPSSKGKNQKGETTQGQGSSSSSGSPSVFKLTDSNNESINSSILDALFEQISSIQETLNQHVTTQKESQKQMEMTVAKEGKRNEVSLGKNMEKAVKANSDALWARIQEENMKREKASREQTQQVISAINNSLSKDLPAILEKTIKRELSAVVQSVTRTITPAIEKTITTSIVECFQKGVNDKAVNQLEKSVISKLETTVARQIQVQFQTSGKQVLQETLKSSLEGSVIPAFEMSCRALFEQVDATFQKGMVEHTAAAQQQLEASHSPLALALRDAINSASSMTQTMSTELLDGQRKLLALATNSKSANPLISQLSNGPLVGLHEKIDIPLDPTKELSRLIGERKYEEAFTTALQRSDVTIVSWLCYQVDLPGILILNPLPLSQGVLLSLLQQLACDIGNETSRKLTWMRDVLSALNPTDPMIAVHVRPIFEQVYQILHHHRTIPSISGSDMSSIRLIMHVINSMLMSSK